MFNKTIVLDINIYLQRLLLLSLYLNFCHVQLLLKITSSLVFRHFFSSNLLSDDEMYTALSSVFSTAKERVANIKVKKQNV